MDEKKSLSKEECEEFFTFVRDTVYHKPLYVAKSEIVQFESRWNELPKVITDAYIPDPKNPKNYIRTIENRVEFEPIW